MKQYKLMALKFAKRENNPHFVDAYEGFVAGFEACRNLILSTYYKDLDHYTKFRTLEEQEIKGIGDLEERV